MKRLAPPSRARACLLVLVLLLAVSAAAQDHTAPTASPGAGPQQPVVITVGEALVRATPDRAWVTLAVESRDKSPKVAQQGNARAMAGVQQKMKGAGIPDEAIRTLAYDLHQEFDYVSGKQVPRGYLARNTIEVRVDGVERVGEVIDLAIGAGATSVSGVRFDLKDRDAVEREALRKAVVDARARAEAAASGAGGTIARVVRIDEQRGPSPGPPQPVMFMKAAEATAEAPGTTISAGEIEVRAQVRLTAELR